MRYDTIILLCMSKTDTKIWRKLLILKIKSMPKTMKHARVAKTIWVVQETKRMDIFTSTKFHDSCVVLMRPMASQEIIKSFNN